ncbi:oxygenase MpaB family protein [Streptomonospora nanhaiensis]|uniref:Oxygenase MpaB family protein n=1 Tax=Streptomonospora nanhaiensis TaxID=1323731 RepID=A0ABY6YK85_9ACTN|nr:oxygenase MpaB family protein [Streptomonospora nanhaiensis]WAE72606.1 oxygenase MpaB family protein [Streptomonospora nanhaiensis]
MKRFEWRDTIQALDAEADCERIVRILGAHEFPWDFEQALGLALYRTYAVPSIGELLAHTREFTERTQHRYDDTALILNDIMEHGFGPGRGRDALRRMNQMHRSYDIGNDDYRYVLSTFVVMPVRWLNDWGYGWRRLTDHEIAAGTNYYRKLGKHMGIKDIPGTYEEFRDLLDSYEREHFAYTEGGRAVSDSTLGLMADFYPAWQRPLVRPFTKALLDDRLIKAFGYPEPSAAWRRLGSGALKLRARVVRLMPPREKPRWARESANVRSYPEGYEPSRIGTFPQGCPVPHGMLTREVAPTGARVPAPDQAVAPAGSAPGAVDGPEAPGPAGAAGTPGQ